MVVPPSFSICVIPNTSSRSEPRLQAAPSGILPSPPPLPPSGLGLARPCLLASPAPPSQHLRHLHLLPPDSFPCGYFVKRLAPCMIYSGRARQAGHGSSGEGSLWGVPLLSMELSFAPHRAHREPGQSAKGAESARQGQCVEIRWRGPDPRSCCGWPTTRPRREHKFSGGRK